MKKFLAKVFFAIAGWKMEVKDPKPFVPSVMIAAPHTTNWDFPYALAAFWIMGIPLKYFIKDVYTKGPWGWFFRWTGAIGVNRKVAKGGLTQLAIDILKTDPGMVILVPAEGTRKRVEKWRTGFYRIATEAGVPISLGYLDYKKKQAGVGFAIKPKGNFEQDMEQIQDFYAQISPKFPEKYNKQIY
jgi:1-acyl-sn-glycerol-3-phosphate acyltransferase